MAEKWWDAASSFGSIVWEFEKGLAAREYVEEVVRSEILERLTVTEWHGSAEPLKK